MNRNTFSPYTFILLPALLLLYTLGLSQSEIKNKSADNAVKIVGSLQNVMHNGELFGRIAIDSISNKHHLYGIGPLENLSGEILIMDGRGYQSKVVNDTAMQVTTTHSMEAPFFVYANVDQWMQFNLPKAITTLALLETYINQISQKIPRPFCFKVNAQVDTALIHILNLPSGTKVTSPEDAHQGQINYVLRNKTVDLIGFFSTEHQGIFTHQDSFVHIHLITEDRKQMGHLETIKIIPGTAKLFLPVL